MLIIHLTKNRSSNRNCQDQRDTNSFAMEMGQYEFMEKQGGSKLICGKYHNFKERQMVQTNFLVVNLGDVREGGLFIVCEILKVVCRPHSKPHSNKLSQKLFRTPPTLLKFLNNPQQRRRRWFEQGHVSTLSPMHQTIGTC